MKRPNVIKVLITIGVIIGIVLIVGVIRWLSNGGWPATGPTGGTLPPHIQKVDPADGGVVTETNSFCVYFDFRAGQGMGNNPEKTIYFFHNGFDVTNKVDGLVTLNYPPSGGLICYKPGKPLSSGWHTAKVTYKDSANHSFSYTWRFQITGK
jgi:hypothetical protein